MPGEEKRIWGIHTKDDNLFLHQDVIAIVITPKTENRLFFLWMKDMSRDFRQMRMNRSALESR